MEKFYNKVIKYFIVLNESISVQFWKLLMEIDLLDGSIIQRDLKTCRYIWAGGKGVNGY